MSQLAYREIRGPDGPLAKLVPFDGNSMYGAWEGNTYQVKSYGTVIATANTTKDHKVLLETWITDKLYSRTTSKHVNYCRAWLGVALVNLSSDDGPQGLKNLLP